MIERPIYLEQLLHWKDHDVIKVVTGVRRCGKSTMLKMFRKELQKSGVPEENIISLNLEDIEGIDINDYRQLLQYFVDRLQPDGRMNYIFIDEVQQVNGFEKAVDALYVKENCDVYITGSNSRMLSGELATLLSGRCVKIKMQPLSFAEYVSAYPGKSPERLYMKYLENGSFPYVVNLEEQAYVREYLSSIFDAIMLKDIMVRNRCPDQNLLKKIARFLFDNIGNPCSTKKIADTLTSMGTRTTVPTVEKYLGSLQDSFLFYQAERFDVKGKEYLKTGGKYYAVDMGLRKTVLGNKPADMGHILENIVYLELKRRWEEVYVGKVGDTEIDFVVMQDGERCYYQVAYTVIDEDGSILKRELAPLRKIKDYYQRYLITMDMVPSVSHEGITQVYALDWLLGYSD
ncbi:MAG: ATP-binding protein [Selenomonadaceae bacterium]|nr:ATP-binding protein [Selenomonadaceae bacterium]